MGGKREIQETLGSVLASYQPFHPGNEQSMGLRNQRSLRGTARDERANQTRMGLAIGTFSLPSLLPPSPQCLCYQRIEGLKRESVCELLSYGQLGELPGSLGCDREGQRESFHSIWTTVIICLTLNLQSPLPLPLE